MKKTKIALVACSNGLGHTRRLICLSNALRNYGSSPIIFAPKNKVHKISKALGIVPPKSINFNSSTKREDWLLNIENDWSNKLPPLNNYDHVISDNLIEILKVRPDAWLSGSFFWHKSLSEFPDKKAETAEKLLKETNPRIISSSLFTAPYIRPLPNLLEVGLYTIRQNNIHKHGSNILLSCGTGGEMKEKTMDLVNKIVKSGRPICNTLFIEPNFYSETMPYWIQPATFTEKMYSTIKCAVVRPGVGTVTEAILSGVYLFCFYEPENDEMKNNAKMISEAQLGENSIEISDAWNNSQNWLKNPVAKSKYLAALSEIDYDGANQSARAILGQDIL